MTTRAAASLPSYAWGDDYHELIRPLLYELDAFIRRTAGARTLGKCLVDTGPVLERDWAHVAGIGFTGKNCCTIAPGQGSWLLLATLLVPEVLATTASPLPTEHRTGRGRAGRPAPSRGIWPLGRCRSTRPIRTQVATQTLAPAAAVRAAWTPVRPTPSPAPIISTRSAASAYWTIEARQPIPRDLRPLFGNRIFGCDICQEVCPYNRTLAPRTPLLAGLHARDERMAPPLLEGFAPDHPYWLDDAAFSDHLPPFAHQAGQTPRHAAQRLRRARQLGRTAPPSPRCAWPCMTTIRCRASTPPGHWARSAPPSMHAGARRPWLERWQPRPTHTCATRLRSRWQRKSSNLCETSASCSVMLSDNQRHAGSGGSRPAAPATVVDTAQIKMNFANVLTKGEFVWITQKR